MNYSILLALFALLVVACIWILVHQAIVHARYRQRLQECERSIDLTHLAPKLSEAETAKMRSAIVKKQKREARQRKGNARR